MSPSLSASLTVYLSTFLPVFFSVSLWFHSFMSEH